MTEQTTDLPSTAKEAKAAGSLHYSTGKPCIHGHTAPRYASDWTCVECSRKYARQTRQAAKRRRYLDSLPSTRQEAAATASRFFYTGPCSHGHDSERYTSNGHCQECHRLWNAGTRYRAKPAPAVDLSFVGSVPADLNPLIAQLVAQGIAVRLEVRQ